MRPEVHRKSYAKGAAVLLLSTALAAAMWFYVTHVLIPHQVADAARDGRPRGNLSDLYPRWLGSRELLLHHRNPYSPEITSEIQQGYYGRRLDPSQPNDPKDQQGFAYPVYVALLLAPTVHAPFPIVQRVFIWVLVVVTILSVFCWMGALRWWPGLLITLAISVLTLGSFQCIQGLKLQQLTLLVVATVAASVYLLTTGRFFWAGILLACATIKPQLLAPISAFLLIWVFAGWRERQRLFWSFTITLAVLLCGATILLPGWMLDFWHAMAEYRRYTGAKSMFDIMLGSPLGSLLSALTVVALIFFSWRFRRFPSNSPEFALIVAFILAATLAIIPMFAIYNQLLLLPAILLGLRDWRIPRTLPRLTRMLQLAAAIALGWPWCAALALAVASLFLRPQQLQRAWPVPLWTMIAIPFITLALLLPPLLQALGQLRVAALENAPGLALHDRTG